MLQTLIWVTGTAIYQHYFKLQCHGLDNLPAQSGYILAANHSSHLDGPAIIAAHGQTMQQVYSLVAKDYFFDQPLKGWVCQTLLNMVPINRGGKFLDCLPACQKIISENKNILIFPEGTRSRTGKLQTFKLGLGALAIKLGVPIVPTYVQGTYQSLPKGQYFPKQHPIRVCFGQPLSFEHYSQRQEPTSCRKVYSEIVQDVAQAITGLQYSL